MHVSVVLQDKGTKVVTTTASTSLAEIVSMLDQHRIGAVVVSGDGHGIDGVVSERDIVHALAAAGPAALGLTAADVMTRAPVTCAPDSTIESLMSVMTERRVRHIPVTDDDGRLTGLVSIGDVVKSRISILEHEAEALQSYITNPY